MKKTCFFSENMFFLTREKKTYFFSHLVSWLLMIRSLRRFKPLYWYQPWIYPSQYPSCCLYFHPAGLAGSSRKKGPDALGTCRTTLSVITVNLESLDDFSPIFHWEKMILDCQSPTNSRTKVFDKNLKIMKNQSKFSVFHHFGWQF